MGLSQLAYGAVRLWVWSGWPTTNKWRWSMWCQRTDIDSKSLTELLTSQESEIGMLWPLASGDMLMTDWLFGEASRWCPYVWVSHVGLAMTLVESAVASWRTLLVFTTLHAICLPVLVLYQMTSHGVITSKLMTSWREKNPANLWQFLEHFYLCHIVCI
jgi:cytochrome bd-type quinol oxidase subunit 2